MVGTLLLLALSVREDISFSNWQFKTTLCWIQSRDSGNMILTPYANARARVSRCEFRPAVTTSQPLAAWACAEWTRLVGGKATSFLDKPKPTVFPRGMPGIQHFARFGTGENTSTLRLIVFNPTGEINAVVYTAR